MTKHINTIISVIFIAVVLFDVLYWNGRSINKAYERGYTEAMAEASRMLDSTSKVIAGQDTTITITIVGKDTTYQIFTDH